MHPYHQSHSPNKTKTYLNMRTEKSQENKTISKD